jgi:hypothetical protein
MLLFCDSFSHYTTLLQKWDNINSASPVISATAARTQAAGLLFNAISGQCAVLKNFSVSRTVILGFAYQVKVSPSAGNNWVLCAFNDITGVSHVFVRLSPSGTFQFVRSTAANNTTGVGANIGPVSSLAIGGGWHYIEITITIDPVVGAVEMRLDGNVIITAQNVNTKNAANNPNSTTQQLAIGNLLSNDAAVGTHYYADLYLNDTNGNQCNSYLGDVTVEAQLPSGNGTENDFTRGGSVINAQNWMQVDEVPPDDDTTYNFDSVVGHMERYTYPALVAASTTIYALATWPRAEKTSAGARNFRHIVASQGVVVDNGVDIGLAVGYTYPGMAAFYTDPATGQLWTQAGINAAETGFEITL